ncbi:unnamed protein product [Lota lota]
MRSARRASAVEVPSFLRHLAKETEKMVTFFFKGGPRERDADEDPDGEDSAPSPYLDRPVLEKQVAEGGSARGVSYGVASMQGWRSQMEDAHTCMAQLKGELAAWSYFAVFDGHAGSTVAQYCSRNLLDHILATGALKAEEDPEEVKEGIGSGFLAIDSHMHQLTRRDAWERSGSTAAAVFVSPHHLYFVNCGDSRTLLCRGGEVAFCTEDHKPCNPRERERIQNAGGSVTLQRVNGSLAVSRALGDFNFKEVDRRPQTEQLVSPEPEVYETQRSGDHDEFVILACDGVWDAIGNEELCAFVRSRLQVCDDLREVCSQVLDLCLYKGSLDNMSIILVCFPGAPQLSQKALQDEAELEQLIDLKVGEIIALIRSREEDPDLVYVFKFLTSENVPGLPPGGGVISKRDCIISAYQKYITAGTSQEPMGAGRLSTSVVITPARPPLVSVPFPPPRLCADLGNPSQMSSEHNVGRELLRRGEHTVGPLQRETEDEEKTWESQCCLVDPQDPSLLAISVCSDPRRNLEEALEESTSRRMHLNAGEPASYGSIAAAAYTGVPRKTGDVESAPLLTSEPGGNRGSLLPLNKEELEEAAGGPRWTKIRSRLVLLFWLSWLTMLVTAVAIIVQSPRPAATPRRWWQKSLFYQLQPALFMDSQPGSLRGIEAVRAHLPYIKALGVGAMVLEGLFLTGPSPDGPVLNDSLVTGPQMEHLLKESSKVGLRVVIDLCELNMTTSPTEVLEVNNISGSLEQLTTVQYALKSWLEKGVAGFAICDTDPAYSERTLTEWRLVIKEFSEEDRIVLVKQTGEDLNSTRAFNSSLVEVVMRSILPPTHHILSAQEVAESMAACLQDRKGAVWPSWMVGGQTSSGFQKLLLVLVMTLPGTPTLRPGEELSNTGNGTLTDSEDMPSSNMDKERRLAVALFTSLSLSRAREEALLSGSFSVLSFNGSSTLPPPVLGFVRSWGCVQFLVVLNISPDPQDLDPNWAQGLPSAGVFVVSTGLDRMGSVALHTLTLRPQEAIVIKLVEARSFS